MLAYATGEKPLTGHFGIDRLAPGPESYADTTMGMYVDSPVYPPRHGKTYNVGFCDGHVSSDRPETLFSFKKSAALWNSDHEPHPETWY